MGKVLEKEYIQLYSMMKDLGDKKNIRIPIDSGRKKKKKIKGLNYEIAEDFDRQFFEITVKDHESAIKKHQKFLAEDPDLLLLIKHIKARLKKNLAFILLNLNSIIEQQQQKQKN